MTSEQAAMEAKHVPTIEALMRERYPDGDQAAILHGVIIGELVGFYLGEHRRLTMLKPLDAVRLGHHLVDLGLSVLEGDPQGELVVP